MTMFLSIEWPTSNVVVERLGWVLVHSLWQFALAALLAGLAVRVLRRHSAQLRYGVLVAALAVSSVAPVATWLLQRTDTRPIPVADIETPAPAEELIATTTLPPDFPFSGRPTGPSDLVNNGTSPDIATSSPTDDARPAAAHPTIVTQSASSWSERATAVVRPWLVWIVTGWGLGVLLCSARPLLGWRTLRRLQRIGVSPVSDEVLLALRRVSDRLGLRYTVRVLQSTLTRMPLVVGYLRPVILLPVSLVTSIPVAQLDALLAHELAHIRRHDFAVNLLQTLVETLFFFHPAVWWLSRRIRVEREHCCDDLVVKLLGNRFEYGRALVAIEQQRGRQAVLALGAADGSLLSRVRRIVGLNPERAAVRLSDRWPVALLSLACLAVVFSLSLNWRLAAKDDDPEITTAAAAGAKVSLLKDAAVANPLQLDPLQAANGKLRLDAAGDPLPAGMIQRLGTTRYKTTGWWRTVVFAGGDEWMWCKADNRVSAIHRETGRVVPHERLGLGAGSVHAIAVSTDGEQVAIGIAESGMLNGFVGYRAAVLDAKTGLQTKTVRWRSEPSDLRCLAFGNGGRLLVTGTERGDVRLWDVEKEREIGRQSFDGAELWDAACSPDGRTIVLAGYKNSYLWRPGDEVPPRELTPKISRQVVSAFSPDGRWFATGNLIEPDGTRLWDAATGELKAQLKSDGNISDPDGGLCFSPDSQTLAVPASGADEVELWDVKTAKRTAVLPVRGSRSVAFSRNGTWLAATGGDACVSLFDVATLKEINPAGKGHTDPVHQVRFADGSILVSTSHDGAICVWDVQQGRMMHRLEHDDHKMAREIAVSPDGTTLVSSAHDDTLGVWDLKSGKRLFTLPGHGALGGARAVRFTPDGSRFASWGDDMELRWWNAKEGTLARKHEIALPGHVGPERPQELKGIFTSDAGALCVLFDGKLHEFDTASGKRSRFEPLPGATQMAISENGIWLATAERAQPDEGEPSPKIVLRDRKTLKPVRTWVVVDPLEPQAIAKGDGAAPSEPSVSWIGELAFSADSKQLAWSRMGRRNAIDVAEVAADGIKGLIPLSNACWCLEFSADGTQLASGSYDTTVSLWQLDQFRGIPKAPPVNDKAGDKEAFGPESNGLRCRLAAVPVNSDDESPEVTKQANMFACGDDVTLAVELKNVSDKPLTLLGVRHGNGQPGFDGKLATGFFAPHLFELKFTDAAGKPVPRTSREFFDREYLLAGASAQEIAPGKSLVVLLRPAHFHAPMDHRLPPGQYRAAIRYRGPSAKALAYLKENLSDKPQARAWSGDAASKSVTFTVADDPSAAKPAALVWGEVKDGLQGAVEFRSPPGVVPTNDPPGTFPSKPYVSTVFHVKNVSDRTITFVSETARQLDDALVTNEAGETRRLESAFFTGWPILVRWTLKPGEVAELHVLSYGIGQLDQPGKYTLRYKINFGSLGGFDKEIYWQETLVTGDVPVTIRKRTEADDDAAGKPLRGKISSVDRAKGLARIDLGQAHSIKPRMMFEVRSMAPADDKDRAGVVKGTVEVVRVLDEITSEVRIITEQLDGPVQGDEVVSLVLRPGRPAGGGANEKPAAAPADKAEAAVIDPNGEIVGRLVDAATGKPVEGATIACGAVINDSLKGGGTNTVTDAQGRYRMPVPSPGIYNVWLKKFDKDPAMTAAVDDGLFVEAGKVSMSQLLLAKGRKVAGRVVDAEGNPIAKVNVSCESTGWPKSAKSKDDGTFQFDLPLGRVHVYAYESAAQTKDNPFGVGRRADAFLTVSPTEEVSPITLILQAHESKFGDPVWLIRSTPGTRIVRHENAADVTGTVVDEAGKPIPGAKLFKVDGPIHLSNDKGEFKVEISKGTQFVMHAFAPGYHVWFGTPTSGDVLKIVLEKKLIEVVAAREPAKTSNVRPDGTTNGKPVKDVEQRTLEIVRRPFNPEPDKGSWYGGAFEMDVYFSLSQLPQQERVVKTLLKIVDGTEKSSLDQRRLAMMYLGGAAPRQVIPLLIKELKEAVRLPTAKFVPYHEMAVLGRIGEEAKDAVPVLIKLLDHPEGSVRMEAILALVKVGPSSIPVMNAIATRFDDPSEEIGSRAVYEAGRYGELAKPLGPTFVKLLDSKSKSVRTWAAQALAKSGFDETRGFDTLIGDVAKGSTLAATALAALGSQAKAMIPRLRPFENNPDESLAKEVRDAIRRIEKDDRIFTHAEEAAKAAASRKAAAEATAKLRAEADQPPADGAAKSEPKPVDGSAKGEAAEGEPREPKTADAVPRIRTWSAVLIDGMTGTPLPGVVMQARGAKVGEKSPQLMTLTSDAMGRIEVPLADGTGTTLLVKSAGWWAGNWPYVGYFPASDVVKGKEPVSDPAQPVKIKLWKGTHVTGRLLTSDGKPASGVALNVGVYVMNQAWKERLGLSLTFYSWDHGEWPNWSMQVVTAEDGTFETTVPPADARSWVRVGTTQLGFGSVDPKGLDAAGTGKGLVQFAPFETEREGPKPPPPPEETERLDFGPLKLERGVVLRGRVLDADGKPLSGVHLYTSGKRGPYAGRMAISGEGGKFEFLPLEPGSFTLTADARLRDAKGEVNSRDVQGVFVPAELTLPRAAEPSAITIRAIPHVTVEFEWVDRRAKKGPVAYYGEFNVTGRVPREGASPAWWRGSTELIERDGRKLLMMKIPVSLTEAKLALPADHVVTASYEDDQKKSGPGQVELGDVTVKLRRIIYGDEPKKKEPAAKPVAVLDDSSEPVQAEAADTPKPVDKQDDANGKKKQEMSDKDYLPEWLKPHYDHGLLATLDKDHNVVTITAGVAMSDELLAHLPTLPKLRELYIETTTKLTPAGLAPLAKLSSLRRLTLYTLKHDGEGLGDAAIAHIVGLKGLLELSIGSCGTTDAGVRQLESLPQLTHLSLGTEGRLTDAALTSLGKMTRLRQLHLSSYVATEDYGRMRFTAAGIRQLSKLQELEELHLVGHEVPADALNFPKLKALSLGLTDVDDACAARVAECRGLESLNLVYTKITDEGLKVIARLPLLRQLNLDSDVVTDAGIGHLKELSKLTMVSLRAARLTDESLLHLAHIKSLTRLDLEGSGKPGVNDGRCFTISGVQQLKALPNLRTLTLTNFHAIDDYSGLAELRQLRELNLIMANIRQDELDSLGKALPDAVIHHATGGGSFVPSSTKPAD